MIYIVKKCVAYEGYSVACATNNLAFAEEVFEIETNKSGLTNGLNWTELVCLDGQKHYRLDGGDIMKTTYNESDFK